jgi:hypothetical protein
MTTSIDLHIHKSDREEMTVSPTEGISAVRLGWNATIYFENASKEDLQALADAFNKCKG